MIQNNNFVYCVCVMVVDPLSIVAGIRGAEDILDTLLCLYVHTVLICVWRGAEE